MNKAETLAVATWAGNCCLTDWVHSRTIIMGAKLMCEYHTDAYQTLEFLHAIAGERVQMEIEKNGY